MTKNLITELMAEVDRYRPTPWIVVPQRGGFEEFGHVYSVAQDPETDSPIVTADTSTCLLIAGLVNREAGHG